MTCSLVVYWFILTLLLCHKIQIKICILHVLTKKILDNIVKALAVLKLFREKNTMNVQSNIYESR